MDKKGFSLIELLTVVAILGILAAIAIPAYRNYTINSARQEATTNLQGLSLCLQQYYAENAVYTPALNTSYKWQMSTSGVVTTNTFNGPASNPINWLSCFNPQKAAGSINNYTYTVVATSSSYFSATAIPDKGPVLGDGNLTIDSNGAKTPSTKWPQ